MSSCTVANRKGLSPRNGWSYLIRKVNPGGRMSVRRTLLPPQVWSSQTSYSVIRQTWHIARIHDRCLAVDDAICIYLMMAIIQLAKWKWFTWGKSERRARESVGTALMCQQCNLYYVDHVESDACVFSLDTFIRVISALAITLLTVQPSFNYLGANFW